MSHYYTDPQPSSKEQWLGSLDREQMKREIEARGGQPALLHFHRDRSWRTYLRHLIDYPDDQSGAYLAAFRQEY